LSNIVPFAFEGRQVRVVTRDGDPWFVLADVCAVLDIGNTSMAASRLDADEKHTLSVAEGIADARVQALIVISEPGLYRLILRSDKPQAKPFQKWVTGTVLPSILKTGSYSTAPVIDLNDPAFLRATLLTYAEKTLALQAEVATLAPKAKALARIEGAEGDMTPTAAAKILKIDEGIATRRAMLAGIDRTGSATVKEMAEAAGVSCASVSRHVHRLLSKGHIVCIKPVRNLTQGHGKSPAVYARATQTSEEMSA
jgi:prophage antirepressor-like protein